MEASAALVPVPDFKSGGGRGDTSPAGSIPVRFRPLHRAPVGASRGACCDNLHKKETSLNERAVVVISFKDMPSDERVRETLEKGCARLTEEFPEIVRCELTLSPDGAGHTAHAHVTGRGMEIATHEQAIDVRQAADRLIDTLERQLRKAHEKRVFARRREAQRESSRRRS